MTIELVLAPNPSLYTGPGTNTWVVSSEGDAVIIDPGPVIDSHQEATLGAVTGLHVTAVLVTHTHPDHAPAANPIADRLGVPAIGPAAGPEFSPDRLIADGESVTFGSEEAVCIATPGHTPDSVCYRVVNALFTGDHIMGGSTVIVEDMADYMKSLEKIQERGLETLYPGHGPVIDVPDLLIAEYIAHRRDRERQILDSIAAGAATVGEVVGRVYADVDRSLHPAAAISVASHLRKLKDEGAVEAGDELGWDSAVALA